MERIFEKIPLQLHKTSEQRSRGVAGYGGKISFDERMFAYFTRLWMKYDTAVTAVALFTGEGEPPTGVYRQKCFGTNLIYGYTLKTLDEFDEKALRLDDSPAALMILAAKLAKESADNENFKLSYLKELVNLMDERSWSDEDKEYMLTLCEGIIHIDDEEIEEEFWEFIKEKEEPEMFVSIIERKAMAQGRNEGMKEGRLEGEARGISRGKLETAQNMLKMGLPLDVISKATGLSKAELKVPKI